MKQQFIKIKNEWINIDQIKSISNYNNKYIIKLVYGTNNIDIYKSFHKTEYEIITNFLNNNDEQYDKLSKNILEIEDKLNNAIEQITYLEDAIKYFPKISDEYKNAEEHFTNNL